MIKINPRHAPPDALQTAGQRPERRLSPGGFASLAKVSLLAFGLLLSGSCASTSMDHMAVTNYADRTLVPDHKGAQWALTPVLIPLTVVTLAVDNLIIAPVVQLPSAGADAHEFYDIEVEGYYSRMAITPFQIALTPVIFAGSWLGRGFYGADTHPDALWGWPDWGRQWVRDDRGRLVGPPAGESPTASPDDIQIEKPEEYEKAYEGESSAKVEATQ